jgi:hypothetical protein
MGILEAADWCHRCWAGSPYFVAPLAHWSSAGRKDAVAASLATHLDDIVKAYRYHEGRQIDVPGAWERNDLMPMAVKALSSATVRKLMRSSGTDPKAGS